MTTRSVAARIVPFGVTRKRGGADRDAADAAAGPRRVLQVVLATGLIVLVVGGYLVYDRTVGLWNRLRDAADEVAAASGMNLVERREVGTTFCPISCDEARVELDFDAAGMSRTGACSAIEPELRRVFPDLSTAPPLGLAGCLYSAAPGVGDDAFVQVVADACAPQDDALCRVTVRISSGID